MKLPSRQKAVGSTQQIKEFVKKRGRDNFSTRFNLVPFRRVVMRYYREHGRHDLPWRPPALKLGEGKENEALYSVLVSEVMLQQTQVERVVPFYKEFLRKFPTTKALANAPLSDVLRAWQGLGYNRRAKMLHAAARALHSPQHIHILAYRPKYGYAAEEFIRDLEALPGVGPYTARAVAAFAYNEDVIFIETNIRTAAIHHFFPKKKLVSDREIEQVLTVVFPKGKSREWYSALMDYGAYLKRSGVKLNTKSKHYTKQKTFSGSLREARGAILRALAEASATSRRLTVLLGVQRREQLKSALTSLTKEGLVESRKGKFYLPR